MNDPQSASDISSIAEPGKPISKKTSAIRRFISWWRGNSNLAVNISMVVMVFILMITIFANFITPYDPEEIDLLNRMSPPAWIEGGTLDHPLGTDRTGRDVMARVMYGGRVSLYIGIVASTVGLIVGTTLGLISGYTQGWFDQLIMYLIDVQLSLPFILLAVAVALVLGNSLTVLVGIASLSAWPFYARVIRGNVLSLRRREFTTAAKALGASDLHIIWKHLLPNVLSPILVIGTLSLARIILLESGLSFLGIGVPPSIPSWGNMIDEGRANLNNASWIALMPSLVLMMLTMSVGTIGDWLRDLTDVNTEG